MSYHPFGLAEALLRATTQIAKSCILYMLATCEILAMSFSCLRLPAGSTPPAHLGLAKKTWRHITISTANLCNLHRSLGGYCVCISCGEHFNVCQHALERTRIVTCTISAAYALYRLAQFLGDAASLPCYRGSVAGTKTKTYSLLQGFGMLAWVGQQQHSTTFKQLILPLDNLMTWFSSESSDMAKSIG